MHTITSRDTRSRHSVRLGLRVILYGVSALVLGCAVLISLPYLLEPTYAFPAPKPFAGRYLYNPYAGMSSSWQRVNFHAHARAWLRATDGRQPDSEVVRTYRDLGYQATALSNYQHISRGWLGDTSFLPVYEHGYNVDKIHQLVIGARRVDWLDFPWHQTLRNRQFVLDRLHGEGALIAIAHPELRDPAMGAAFRYLANYDLMEIRTHSGIATAQWDTALSTGHAVWGIADDDTHDVTDATTTGRRWTMVNAPSARANDVVAALRAGRMYGVDGPQSGNDVALLDVDVSGDTLTVRLSDVVTRVDFYGENGALLASRSGVRDARYVIPAGAPYVRAQIETGRTTMFLNPVIRWDGVALPRALAVAVAPPRGERDGALAGLALLVTLMPTWTLWRRHRRKRALAMLELTA